MKRVGDLPVEFVLGKTVQVELRLLFLRLFVEKGMRPSRASDVLVSLSIAG